MWGDERSGGGDVTHGAREPNRDGERAGLEVDVELVEGHAGRRDGGAADTCEGEGFPEGGLDRSLA